MSRYSRNIAVIGAEGQKCLSASSVLVIGCGALGGQVAMLLAGAGIGKIGIVDFDTIDISNLQRQLFYTEGEAGKSKAETLAQRMIALNSEVHVISITEIMTRRNASLLIKGYDFVIDATDNPASKLMIERECRSLGVPCCIGGVAGWRGQVTTIVGESAGMETFFPNISDESGMTPCAIEGVIGAAASLIASVQAAEAIKYLTGQGEPLINVLYIADLSTNNQHTIRL